MKAFALIALMSLSTVSFANDIGAAIRINPVVAGTIQGIEKQYEMKCGAVENIKVKNGQLSASISCMNSEEIDGEVFESAVILQIDGTTYGGTIMIQNMKFTFAG